MYWKLHGGSSALQGTNFGDDHGDTAAAASVAVADQSLTGEFDYLFDFDYFRFEAQEGLKYRISLQHPTLPPHWIAIYASDGLTLETEGLKSRSAVPSGSEVLWMATTTEERYLAVRNFGRLTGAYTLTIEIIPDALDDHGDAPPSATRITLGQTVKGTVDGGFDLDYFRLEAVEGQWFHVEALGETLESLTVVLYEADGSTPARMREEDIRSLIDSGGRWVDMIDLKNAAWWPGTSFDWIAPRAGEFYLSVSGAHAKVGDYSLTVTIRGR